MRFVVQIKEVREAFVSIKHEQPGETGTEQTPRVESSLVRQTNRQQPLTLGMHVPEPDIFQQGPPVQWRELTAVGLMVVLCDLTIYGARGFAGPACLFVLGPSLLCFGVSRLQLRPHFWLVVTMLVLLSARLLWAGSGPLILCGLALTAAFAMAAIGMRPFILETAVYATMATVSGLHGLIQYGRLSSRASLSLPRGNWLNIALPIATCCLFAGIFVLANPDVASAFGEGFRWLVERSHEWLWAQLPHPLRIVFWCATGWLTIGLLRPVFGAVLTEEASEAVIPTKGPQPGARHYEAFRNTLGTLIGLFAIYLVFEFATLWFREFPEGFYYAGYAHEGAAWLTVALVLATLVLSFVFRGAVLTDLRTGRLHQLAWIWSFLNLLLALAVYNRLAIYVGFNGMTQMRVIGFFGVTTVVAGFSLVLWKIHHACNFLWLVRRHLWTAFVASFLFLISPVDRFVVSYNTNRILDGDLAACMQIGVQETDTEAITLLLPLLDCEDGEIRAGVQALLADRHTSLQVIAEERQELGWTAFQFADWAALRKLDRHADRWVSYANAEERRAALERFHDYAYQWY
jgi:hypothetical protein